MKNLRISNVFIQVSLVLLSAKSLKASELVDNLSHEKCELENSDCLKKQTQAVLHTFIRGIPELGIKEFDSLRMDDIDVKAMDVHYAMSNLVVRGFNNSIIDDLSVNMAYKLIRLSFHTTLMIDCDYHVDGKMFGISVFGDGRAAIIIKKLEVEMLITFDTVKNEQGKEIMNITNFLYGGDAIDGTYVYLEDLYNGDKVQSEQFHELINKNWRTIAANFVFTIKIIKEIFEAIKIYMRSKPLAELAQYSNK